METYNNTHRRPITPPNERNKAMHLQNDNQMPYLGRQDAPLKDIPYLNQQSNEFSSNLPASTAPSAPVATAPTAIPNTNTANSTANPFVTRDESHPTQNSIISDTPLQGNNNSNIRTQYNAFPFENKNSKFAAGNINSVNKHHSPMSTTTTTTTSSATERNTLDTNKFQNGHSQRNEITYRIEHEVLSILQWKNPVRSGSIFALIVGSIMLTRWYSLLQIGSTLLTLAIGINLVYVNVMLQSRKILTNQEASHPYSDVIDNGRFTMIDKNSVNRYATMLSEVAETVIRALTRIIFIENTATSMKWMAIFFAIWKVSAHVSTMNIIMTVVISAFIFPRLYISNKDVVDAHLHKGQTMLQTGIKQAQDVATHAVQDTYAKSRAFVAKTGTTGTDAKNTMSKHSVTLKDE
ncbi:MAG: Reticulon-domain-containing protein [Benjaminiella poitrasii]|nr:MAG: Reticulon-domain-containing protein [Benjaminiella poitrasii]